MLYRYSFTIWILIFVGSILSGVTSWAKSPVELNDGFESIYLRSELEFLEDPSGLMSLEQVLSAENQQRFQPNGEKVFNQGNTRPSINSEFQRLLFAANALDRFIGRKHHLPDQCADHCAH